MTSGDGVARQARRAADRDVDAHGREEVLARVRQSGELAFVINAIIDALFGGPHVWRVTLGVAAVPAVLLFACLPLLPDSPRW